MLCNKVDAKCKVRTIDNHHKQITLADVAKAARVSTKTVSRVINNEPHVNEATRLRVTEVIQELNYHPNRAAQRLASRRSHVIGMLVPSIDYPIFPIIILGVEKVMHAHNYEVLVYNTDVAPERARRGLELLAENQVDGVMVFTVNHISAGELQELLKRQRSSVLVNNALHSKHSGVVRIDVEYGINLLVEHLFARGRRHIALLTHPKTNYSASERLSGYKKALAKFDLPIDENLVIVCDDSEANVFNRVQSLLRSETVIDAIICYNDLIAATALKACLDLGVDVPGQVAITGFDNLPLTELFKVPLTTVSIPWFEMGVTAAEMLLNRIAGDYSEPEVIFTPELIVRESAL